MTNINDLKFTIELDETIEMEQFVNSDNKEKEKNLDTRNYQFIEEENSLFTISMFLMIVRP